jgi:hypothetical protein
VEVRTEAGGLRVTARDLAARVGGVGRPVVQREVDRGWFARGEEDRHQARLDASQDRPEQHRREWHGSTRGARRASGERRLAER